MLSVFEMRPTKPKPPPLHETQTRSIATTIKQRRRTHQQGVVIVPNKESFLPTEKITHKGEASCHHGCLLRLPLLDSFMFFLQISSAWLLCHVFCSQIWLDRFESYTSIVSRGWIDDFAKYLVWLSLVWESSLWEIWFKVWMWFNYFQSLINNLHIWIWRQFTPSLSWS